MVVYLDCLQRGWRNVIALLDVPKRFVRRVSAGWRRYRGACLACLAVSTAVFAPTTFAQQTPATGSGQAFPVKPVRIVVSGAAGTGLDATTRLIAPKLSDYWKQSVVIDNRQGILANSTVAKSNPDGYTLLFVSGSIAVRHVMFS